jgi:hypothetical protein
MTIEASGKLISQLQALKQEDIAALPPAEKRRLIEALEAVHRVATWEETAARVREANGLLADLRGPNASTD